MQIYPELNYSRHQGTGAPTGRYGDLRGMATGGGRWQEGVLPAKTGQLGAGALDAVAQFPGEAVAQYPGDFMLSGHSLFGNMSGDYPGFGRSLFGNMSGDYPGFDNGSYLYTWQPEATQPGFTPPTFNDVLLIKTVVLSLMFVVSLVGNTATLAQMYRMRRRKSTINTLILHLAVADLVVTFFCNVTDAVWSSTIQWFAGNAMCKLVKFIQVFGLYLSTYIIVIVSLDRCFAILDPMSRNKAPRRVRIMVGTAWLGSVLVSLPQVCTGHGGHRQCHRVNVTSHALNYLCDVMCGQLFTCINFGRILFTL